MMVLVIYFQVNTLKNLILSGFPSPSHQKLPAKATPQASTYSSNIRPSREPLTLQELWSASVLLGQYLCHTDCWIFLVLTFAGKHTEYKLRRKEKGLPSKIGNITRQMTLTLYETNKQSEWSSMPQVQAIVNKTIWQLSVLWSEEGPVWGTGGSSLEEKLMQAVEVSAGVLCSQET